VTGKDAIKPLLVRKVLLSTCELIPESDLFAAVYARKALLENPDLIFIIEFIPVNVHFNVIGENARGAFIQNTN
jgi:hypothetical protein